MDIADYVILLVLLFSAWDGYRTGIIAQMVRLLGTVIAYVAAWQFHAWLVPIVTPWIKGYVIHGAVSLRNIPLVGTLTGTNNVQSAVTAIAGAISFGIVFYVSLLLIRYLGHLLNALFSLPVLSLVNRMVGLIAGASVAFVLIAVLLSVATYIPSVPVKQEIRHSALAPMFEGPVMTLEHLEGFKPPKA